MRILDGVFEGVGTTCRLTVPVNVRDMDAQLYDLVCDGEEGEFTRRALLMRAADDGLIVAFDGYAFKYESCPADPATGIVVSADEIGITDAPEVEETDPDALNLDAVDPEDAVPEAAVPGASDEPAEQADEEQGDEEQADEERSDEERTDPDPADDTQPGSPPATLDALPRPAEDETDPEED